MRGTGRQLLRVAGTLLSVAGIVFVGIRLQRSQADLSLLTFAPSMLALLAVMTLCYAAANVALAGAWHRLLRHLGVHRTLSWSVGVYGRSQLAKYVPGNIFQFAGRQAIGMADGVPAAALVKSAALELGVIAVAAGLFVLLLVPQFTAAVTPVDAYALFVAAVVGGLWLARRFSSIELARALALHVLFLLLAACLFATLVAAVSPSGATRPFDFAAAGAAWVVAWLAGLVTPGAPAGLGVREAVLYGALRAEFGESDLLTAVALSRMVTAAGDLFFFLATRRLAGSNAS